MKMAHPLRFTLNDELGGPCVAQFLFLGPGKAIDVSAVMGDVDEELEVAHDQLRFVRSTDWTGYLFEAWLSWKVIEWREFRSIEKKILTIQRRHVAHLFLLYRSRADGFKVNRILR